MSFVYGGINTDDLEGVNVSAPAYPNMGGLTLDTVDTPGRDGRYYGGSRMTTSVLSFRVTVRGENQRQADQRRLSLLQALDPSLGPRSLRLDNTENWHYPEAVVSEQIEWEKHIDRSKVIYDGTVTFETNFDPAMRQIDTSSVTGQGRVEFIADMGSTVSYPTVIFESGGDIRVRVNDFTVDLHDTPPGTYGVLNWDEYKFYTADADVAQSILYEWEGTPHDSPSVYLVGGEIVARNVVPDPSFEATEYLGYTTNTIRTSTVSYYLRVVSGDYALVLTALEDSSRYQYTYQLVDIGDSSWIAFHVENFQTVGFEGRVDLVLGFRVNGSWEYTYRDNVASSPNGAPGVSITMTAPRPAGSEPYVRVMLYPTRSSSEGLRTGDQVTTDGWMVTLADTEQEALAQVEHYFDGDSVGHIVPGERISSLVNHMEHYERPAIYPGQRVEVEVTPIGSNTATPVIIYPNHRRL